ncbi:hypothetical protein PISL3812_05532 [Talaromyces islandicus]|uniref:Uncharacterized protein n=1 Tax=Talaromyces islandicus TaxID=28573 RepID=A0A0U1M0I2_TALIS|nr:hypothetical protein PISL3812_05532 [Talaromyces islandicus]
MSDLAPHHMSRSIFTFADSELRDPAKRLPIAAKGLGIRPAHAEFYEYLCREREPESEPESVSEPAPESVPEPEATRADEASLPEGSLLCSR